MVRLNAKFRAVGSNAIASIGPSIGIDRHVAAFHGCKKSAEIRRFSTEASNS